ncbi:MAG: ABC transporter permease [Puniceicoccaceae bacterium]
MESTHGTASRWGNRLIKRLRSLRPTAVFRDLWVNRILIFQFSRRSIQARHKGSFLGAGWTVLNPLLLMCLYSFVFGVIFNGRYGAFEDETALDYALGVFLSLTLFQLLAEVFGVSITLIVSNGNLVKKVVLPLQVLPVAAVGAAVYHFLIGLILVFVAVVVFEGVPGPEALFFPLLIFPVVFLALGVAWFFSALGVYIRDLGQLVQFLSLTLMYSSAIFYSQQMVPEGIWQVLRWNPLVHIVEQARGVALWGRPLELGPYLYALGTSLLVFYGGFYFFRKLKRGFADVL